MLGAEKLHKFRSRSEKFNHNILQTRTVQDKNSLKKKSAWNANWTIEVMVPIVIQMLKIVYNLHFDGIYPFL